MAGRVMLVGLDCASPQLVFERYRGQLPTLSALMERGCWGRLRSTVPPITVPAWSCMLSGRDPGELGLYGFRNRGAGSYALDLVTAADVRLPRVWDVAAGADKTSAVLFVPPSFPPPGVHGWLVSCFLTPAADRAHTHPPELQRELEARFGSYLMDASDLATPDRAALLAELQQMSAQHFAIARHLWHSRSPDLMVMVDISLDRFHHAFWQDFDSAHPLHDPTNPRADVGLAYYRHLDALLGELVALADDDTTVIVASDHGARPLRGAIAINEWLLSEGWLVLRHEPKRVTPLSALEVDWSRTRAWGEGGYYARVCLNVEGREPRGCVPPRAYERERDELMRALRELPGPAGEPLAHRVVTPESCYRRVRGLPPDICAFFGDLDYRAIGSVGHGRVHVRHDDRRPDGCNHDWDGLFVMAGKPVARRGELHGLTLYDVGPTLLRLLGIDPPDDWLGRDLTGHG